MRAGYYISGHNLLVVNALGGMLIKREMIGSFLTIIS